ncbi:hypothetical protein Pcinc_035305 [Petrolisthes cinctipes]|uniref:Reverse transcriptase domain-containing protein n=1 Tax=Petrolisthes cinctipes TaxID=88211 RepID=A0AAE1EPH0_PETCI|nr:hypothetical protein Pcinc_035303 [Petrolisthes cinctipes]KAK3858510.1 hypothetical protein Pcinc_035305 [Petrolisthes cinctipes]
MGLVSSGDEYNRRGDQVLGDIPRTMKVVDDILAYDTRYKDHLSHVITIIQRCDKHGITLNADKFSFAKNDVVYCGYNITPQGYTADSRKGSSHFAPDALSRSPVEDCADGESGSDNEVDTQDPLHTVVSAALNAVCEDGTRLAPLKDQTLEKIRAASEKDLEYQALKERIVSGFPEHRHDLEPELRPFWGVRNLLSVDEEFIVYGPRLIIPHSLRRETLSHLHESHQGIDRTKRRARQTVY